MAQRLEAWRPRGAEDGADFARSLLRSLEVTSWARARSLLWAASRLGAFAAARGIDQDPTTLLGVAFIERFLAEGIATWSSPARRTVRSNLYFVAASTLRSGPRPARLSRERALAPYSPAEVAAYLALADSQPTEARRQRASGLIALGAGAGLLGVDLRLVRGVDVGSERGGVLVTVRGPRARVVPVRAELAERALAAARYAGEGFIVGGADPNRRNVTSPLIASLAGGPDLARLSLARLRATWLARCAQGIGLATFMAAAGVHYSQRLADVVAGLDPGDTERALAVLGGR